MSVISVERYLIVCNAWTANQCNPSCLSSKPRRPSVLSTSQWPCSCCALVNGERLTATHLAAAKITGTRPTPLDGQIKSGSLTNWRSDGTSKHVPPPQMQKRSVSPRCPQSLSESDACPLQCSLRVLYLNLGLERLLKQVVGLLQQLLRLGRRAAPPGSDHTLLDAPIT